jgi:hypothetical protein
VLYKKHSRIIKEIGAYCLDDIKSFVLKSMGLIGLPGGLGEFS